MDDAELLKRAIAFDAGLAVRANGFIFQEGDEVDSRWLYTYTIKFTGKGWTILQGPGDSFCMSKSEDGFVYQPSPSNRDDEFFKDTRFKTVRAAFKFLNAWKKREFKRVKDQPGFVYWRDVCRKRNEDKKSKGAASTETSVRRAAKGSESTD